MATNILNSGNALTVWNRSADKTNALARAGASVAKTPKDLADRDVIFAMLANDEATRESIVGSGLLAALPKTATIVNCGTISIALARELTDACAQAGVGYVAAPVLGRPDAAAQAKLNVISAGDPDVVARVQPLLDAIGQKTWHVGTEPAQANTAKIGANFLIASAIGAMGEAFALAEGNGLDPRELFDVVTNTLFAAPAYKNYGAQILEKRFEPAGFQLKLGRKDVGLALAAGESAHANLQLAGALANAFDAAIAAGDGEKDWSAVALQARPKSLSGT
jgi:3-hydroxyisobutyrate dehydrogenase-like beta-hydroxyacid dehydrogenase